MARYYIDENDITDLISDALFGVHRLLDEYKDKFSKIKDIPEDVLFNTEYADDKNVYIDGADNFKEEMINRLDCMWTDKVEEEFRRLLPIYETIAQKREENKA